MISRIKELINPLPGYTILHVTSKVDEMTSILLEMLGGVGGKLNLAIYSDETVESAENMRVQNIANYDDMFRALPRDNDIVIFHEVFLKHSQQGRMLKNAYMTLANAAYIIIIEEEGSMDIQKVKATLEQHEFRAPNEIDIIEGYDLIMAKKMHMWGNGL
ncbi:hypothetical protein [Sulfurimonas sp. HSL3-2]|uniref:hypothetical protein n=1 Tax=Hydrocurvibacter mobilis TaxID=3131936 RepID=UPI0031F94030